MKVNEISNPILAAIENIKNNPQKAYERMKADQEKLKRIKENNIIKLITKLADDTWAVAKKLEVSKESDELKTISGCLHDIRAKRDTEWYKNFKVTNKE